MSSLFRFKKVRTWLTLWLLALALLPLTISSGIIYSQSVQAIQEQGIAKLTAIRDIKVGQINSWLDEREGDLRILSRDQEVAHIMEVRNKTLHTNEDKQYVEEARDLLQRYTAGDKYKELFIVDVKSSKVVLSTKKSYEGSSKKNDPYVVGPLQSENVFIKDIYLSDATNTPEMAFSIPIFDPNDKSQISAILVARVDLKQSIYKLLLDRTGIGQTGETLIVNKDGLALNELRWYENAPLNLKIKAKPASLASQGHRGVVEVNDYRDEKVLAAYIHIPKTGWGFVAKQDVAEVYDSIQKMLFNILIIFATSTVIIIFCSFYIGRKIIVPIQGMKDVSTRLQKGDLSARNTIDRADEFGFLAQAINEMATSIESQVAIQKGSSVIIETLVAAEDLRSAAHILLKNMIAITDSRLAAFYLLDEDGETYEVLTSIGVGADALKSFDAERMEGELGLALASKKIEHITDIPEDTRFTFKAVAGQALPREIVTIPLLDRTRVKAIISLANLKGYSEESLKILQMCWLPMNASLANILASEKTQRLACELADKNEELQVNAEEMQSQTEELQEQAGELKETATELEAQRLQVEGADRLKSEFLSNMSHELRTPLNSVLALSQLMISRGTGKDLGEEKSFLEVIERNGRHLLNLINDILDLSKVESGRMDIFPSVFSSRLAINRAIDTVRPLAEEKGLNIEVNIEAAPEMESDEDKVNQILLNLLSNAVKFTEQGEIAVEVSTDSQMASFVIRDTGIGIIPQDLPHIFDEFRQIDGSVTRKHEGTGLGLAICQKLAALLKGQILVESSAGVGSTFTLELPLKVQHSDNSMGEPSGSLKTDRSLRQAENLVQHAARYGSHHILVVEDNETAALQIQATLEENGYAVVVASDGEEALESVTKVVPSGVVLDLMMPGIDGFQVLETIRSTAQTEKVPVLVLTAKDLTANDRARLKHNNITQLIQKGSVNREELLTAVRSLIEPPGVTPEAAVEKPEEKKPLKLEPKPGGSRTVLIVEDNPDNMFTATSSLAKVDCRIVTARDGKQAVEMAEKERPGLILMDIQLPELSGMEAMRRIKSDPALAGIPIVALTANAMKGDRERILAAGCDDYMSKPFDPEELQDMVCKWLG